MDDWADEYYRGRWIVFDMTNQEHASSLEGTAFFGPYETYEHARLAGERYTSLFAVIGMEDPEEYPHE